MMLYTTVNKLKEAKACTDRYAHLLRALGPEWDKDAPLSLARIVETNGLDDALWAVDKCDGYEPLAREFARWCALQPIVFSRKPPDNPHTYKPNEPSHTSLPLPASFRNPDTA